MTTVHTNVPVLVQRAGYVKAAKQFIFESGLFYHIEGGRLYLETSEMDYDITDWNLQSIRVLLSNAVNYAEFSNT